MGGPGGRPQARPPSPLSPAPAWSLKPQVSAGRKSCRRTGDEGPVLQVAKQRERPRARAPSDCRQVLPAVPAPSAVGSANKEAEPPEDQPDDEHDPEDVKRRREQPTAT